jgi:hypothetical protein
MLVLQKNKPFFASTQSKKYPLTETTNENGYSDKLRGKGDDYRIW